MARLPALREALLRTLEHNMTGQRMRSGAIPRENLRDALSFRPDPDDWRRGADVPQDEIGLISGRSFNTPGSRDDLIEGSSADMADDVYGDMAWQPMPWTRLVNRESQLAEEERLLREYHDLIRSLVLGDAARKRPPYRKLSGPNSLRNLSREMERVRRRNGDGD